VARSVLVIATFGILIHASGGASAAFVGANVQPTRNNCAFSGDALCAGGQVLGDPELAPVFHNVTSASPGAIAVADKSYVDSRIGTANSTSGSASARLGILRAQSGTTVSSQPPLSTGPNPMPNLMRLSTFSTARFQDTITVMPLASSLVGTQGFMTASINIDGSLQASAVNAKSSGLGFEPSVAYADWRLQIQVCNTFLGNVNSTASGFFGAEGVDYSGAVTFGTQLGEDAVVTFSAPIVVGSPTVLQVTFSATTTVNLSSAVVQPLTSGFTLGSADSIYMNTAAWNGIQSARSGSTFVPFSVSSESGINYAQPVPEPRVAVLFLVGLAVLGWRRLRRSPAACAARVLPAGRASA
jgi:hypothetical protein